MLINMKELEIALKEVPRYHPDNPDGAWFKIQKEYEKSKDMVPIIKKELEKIDMLKETIEKYRYSGYFGMVYNVGCDVCPSLGIPEALQILTNSSFWLSFAYSSHKMKQQNLN